MAINDGIDAIRRLGHQLRGMQELADYLERVGSIEQSEVEARARLDAVGKDIAAALEKYQDAQALLAEAKAKAVQVVDDALRQAEVIRTDAMKETDAAREQADQDAHARRGAADTQISLLAHDRDALKTEVDALTARRSALVSEIQEKGDAARTELEGLEARIAAAREQARKLLAA